MKTASQQASGTDIKRYMREVGQRARVAARAMSRAETAAKDSALVAMAALTIALIVLALGVLLQLIPWQ